MSHRRAIGIVLLPILVAGCSTVSSWLPGSSSGPKAPTTTLGQAPGAVIAASPRATTTGSRAAVASPATLTAVGYGSTGSYSQQSQGQQKLMAMRAAQVDAYRNLAEQVYGFRVIGNTAVSAFATQSDSIRSFVDSFLRGARVVSTTALADGTYEVTVELSLSHQFIDCVASGGCAPSPAAGNSPAKCTGAGCVEPSITFAGE